MLTDQCVVLIGGLGTRLGSLTSDTPKPLLPVGAAPFLDVLLGEAVRRGFRDIVLLAGHKAEAVTEYARSLPSRVAGNFQVRVSIEQEPLGTGGAVRHAAPLLRDSFLLLNGDTWFDFNWLDLFSAARGQSAVAARKVDNAGRHETLRLDGDETVIGIEPRDETKSAALVNGGVYVLHKADLVEFPERFSIESDLLPTLIARSKLHGREYSGFFLDIGIPEAFEAAQTEIPARRFRPAVFFDRDGVLNHDDAYVGSVERFRWVDGAKEAVRLANERGYYVFVVTNQAGVARGFYDEGHVRSLHGWVAEELRHEGAAIDDWRYCPYHPDGKVERYRSPHGWRKPEPGMILDLLGAWPVDRSGSILVGDKESDCAAARAAGIRPLLFPGGNLCEFLVRHLRPAEAR